MIVTTNAIKSEFETSSPISIDPDVFVHQSMPHFLIGNMKYLPFESDDKASQITGRYINPITRQVQKIIKLLLRFPCFVYSMINLL